MSNLTNDSLKKSFENAGFSDAEKVSVLTGIAKNRADEQSFSGYFEENWSEAFLCSECFYTLICQADDAYSKYISALPDEILNKKKSLYTALLTLQRRAAQQYLEISALIKNGFSDGAFARWRSMHELSVISSFILKYGEEVAEKFIEAQSTEDRYDWAMVSGAFRENKRHVTFGDILKLTDMNDDVWKENYTVANQTVHASPQGTFGRLGAPEGDSKSSYRSGYGIAAPAIQCANTLALVSSMLFSVFQDEKTIRKMTLAANWLEELTDVYLRTHEKLFGEEA